MNESSPTSGRSDRDLLRAFGRRDPAALEILIARHRAFVSASVTRRLGSQPGNPASFGVTRAVFEVLARRAPRLRVKATLGPWLFHVTKLACARVATPGRPGLWRRLRGRFSPRSPVLPVAGEADWGRVAPQLDAAVDRLRATRREAILLRCHGHEVASVAALLGITEGRAARWLARGWDKIARRLRRQGVVLTAEQLELMCCREVQAAAGGREGEESFEIAGLSPVGPGPGRAPVSTLARAVLRTLAWARWRRRLWIGGPSLAFGLAVAIAAWWAWDARTGHSRTLSWFLTWSVKREARTVPGLAQPARAWPGTADARLVAGTDAGQVREAADIYRTTNIWLAHLRFDRDQWGALEPRRIEPLPHFLQPDGTALLRNPEALRGGLAGVLGYDFDWGRADLEFGGRRFTNVAARIKGNGTFLGSLYGDKRSFKVDLNRWVRGQKFAGGDELNFHNLVNDYSNLSDALGYEFFREAGVPAPRTAFAYLSVSVSGRWVRRPLGLYAMVEPVDESFAEDILGSRRTALFKPVTYDLFRHLGDDWAAYQAIYDLRSEASWAQRRLIEFSRLVTEAADGEFAAKLGEFLDLDAFARFMAVQVLLSNYDSLLSTGQNFYLYLDPRSNRFGFIPWDLDLAWGGFFLLGTTRERERASIWHPWVGTNRFLERVFAVETFRGRYRSELESILARLFLPGRLHLRIDALAAVVREPVAAESDFRRRKFEVAIGSRPEASPGASKKSQQGVNRPVHQLKRFVTQRAQSVRQQLNGESNGEILQRRRH